MAPRVQGFHLAVVAGCFGAGASLFSKFATSSFINEGFQKMGMSIATGDVYFYVVVALKFMSFAVSLLCNALMWTAFSKSLQSLSSLSATIINSSSNLFIIAILGWFLLGEKLNATWFIGAVLIIMGLVIMNACSTDEPASQAKEKTE